MGLPHPQRREMGHLMCTYCGNQTSEILEDFTEYLRGQGVVLAEEVMDDTTYPPEYLAESSRTVTELIRGYMASPDHL